jgi:hypothetical protein
MSAPSICVTPDLINDWLEWAGSRLLAAPSNKIKPSGPKVIWPDYAQERFQILDFRKGLNLRAPPPGAKEIPVMEEILLLPNLCSEVRVRRVLHARCLVNPLTYRNINSWTKIAILIHVSRETARLLHHKGLEEVSQKIDYSIVCRVSAFFA